MYHHTTSQLLVALLDLILVSPLCAFGQTLDLELLGSLQESRQLFLGHVHLVAYFKPQESHGNNILKSGHNIVAVPTKEE